MDPAMPAGSAMASESTSMNSVLTMAGSIDTLLLVYSHENMDGLKYGMPLSRM